MPALLTLRSNEGKRQQNCDGQERHDEKKRRLHIRRQIREDGVNPQEEEIGFGNSLDDRGIRLSTGAEGAEHQAAYRDRGENSAGKYEILPESAGDERNAVGVCEVVVLLHVCLTTNDAAWHGPIVYAELQHHPHMQEDE